MSGLPIDIFDPVGGSVYGLVGARPNWAHGASRKTARADIPRGYYFNPAAFAEAIIQPNQPIPSAHDSTALAGDIETDLGTVGRNVLRGPLQSNLDLSVAKVFSFEKSRSLQFRVDFFNLLNHPSHDNAVSNLGVAQLDTQGQIVVPGDFGRLLNYDSSPRIIQLSLKFYF